MALPGTAAIPAVDSQRLVAAEETGQGRGAAGAEPDHARPHHHARVGRERVSRPDGAGRLDQRDRASHGGRGPAGHSHSARAPERRSPTRRPVLVDLKPVGEGYMEDFHAAGGIGAVLRELRPLLNLDCLTVDGTTLRAAAGRRRGLGRPQGDPLVRRAGVEGGRADRAEGQPGARRRDLQARGGHASAVRGRRTRGRVRGARGSGRAHRRSRTST